MLPCPRAYERMFRGADCLNQPQKEANEAKWDALRTPSHQDLISQVPHSFHNALLVCLSYMLDCSGTYLFLGLWRKSRSHGASGWQPIGWANGSKTRLLCRRAAEPQPRRGFISTTRLCPNICPAKVTMRISCSTPNCKFRRQCLTSAFVASIFE